jgi:hypothetical protein
MCHHHKKNWLYYDVGYNFATNLEEQSKKHVHLYADSLLIRYFFTDRFVIL